MKNLRSLAAVLVVITTIVIVRVVWFERTSNVFEWDALGYYLYLPAKYIYHDSTLLKWWPEISSKYHFPGGFYQALPLPNGNFVFFYSCGISMLQTPFFFIGHYAAAWLHFPQDGFSAPYYISIALGTIFYSLIGLLFLRRVLLHFFSDNITSITLVITALATNYIQYVSVDAGQTHAYLFTLYCMVMFYTIRWHQKPGLVYTAIICFIVGLATVCRPTDAVMLFIPLLWHAGNKEAWAAKWLVIKQNKLHIPIALVFGILPVIPQLLYWKESTGHYMYTMPSKWVFLTPYFRVLFGWEKGWFIYTPVTILMVAGLFLMKSKPYRYAVLVYFLLNTWIIISWFDWRYGATYSSRALAQSLAVLSIPLALLLQKAFSSKWKIPVCLLLVYLLGVNQFQIWQYNHNILHYDFMNRKFYGAIYLNPNPTPIDMSLMSTDEVLRNTDGYQVIKNYTIDSLFVLNGTDKKSTIAVEESIGSLVPISNNKNIWLKLSAEVKSDWGAYDTYFTTEVLQADSVSKKRAVRMQNGTCRIENWNRIEYFFHLEDLASNTGLKIYFETSAQQNIRIRNFNVSVLQEKN